MFHRIIHPPTKTTTRFRGGLHDRRALRETLPANERHKYHDHPPPATEAVFFEYTRRALYLASSPQALPSLRTSRSSCSASNSSRNYIWRTAQIDEFPEYRFVKDKFQSREEGQNWNYDFVIVTSIKDEGHKLVDDLQRKNSMRNIVSAWRTPTSRRSSTSPGSSIKSSSRSEHLEKDWRRKRIG